MAASPQTSSPKSGWVRALIQGDLPPVWGRRLGLVAILGGVCLAAALLAGGGRSHEQIPALGRDDLGRPYEAATAGGFKASRDFSLPDLEGTSRRRAEARQAVLPVYDLNPGVHDDVRARIRVAFGHVRQTQQDAAPAPSPQGKPAAAPQAKPNGATPAKPTAVPPAKSPEGVAGGAVTAEGTAAPLEVQPAAQPPVDQAELRAGFETALFGLTRDGLEDVDYRALLRAEFSEELEDAILTLVERAYQVPVVSSRDELGREAPVGLTLRNVRTRAEVPIEGTRTEIRDLLEAREVLERFASVPGNLLVDRPGLERRAALRIAQQLVRPDLTINAAETEARRKAAERGVKESTLLVRKGQRVIGDGELITEAHLQILSGMREQVGPGDRLQLQVGAAGLTALLALVGWLFFGASFRRWYVTPRDAGFMGLLLSAMLGLTHVWMTVTEALREASNSAPVEALPYAIPVVGAAMVVRFLLNARAALFYALVQSALIGVLLGNGLSFGAYALVGSLVGQALIGKVQDRAGILKAGLLAGGVSGAMVLFLRLVAGEGMSGEVMSAVLVALIGTAVMTPVIVLMVTPLAENLFGYASDIKLLELANLNHPALKELIVQAPGTYHHSIIMGTLVEKAAVAIGANPLLARTCAYYHDIGKGRNPLYFGENQRGENRHDTLAPALSATIIKRHVADGLEMARHYGLPRAVANVIPEHHGTRVVGNFLRKAILEAKGRGEKGKVDDDIYHYPGPKPQSRETALVMISDAVEATCRMLPEPTPPKLQEQVQKMINQVFSEGQLDECDLTLKDLHLIADSFSRTLQGIYHSRPEVPSATGGVRAMPMTTPSAGTAALEPALAEAGRAAGSVG